ncbi:MAG: NAD(P)-dependent oxidoreductase [Euzebyaceae bacterium]|nr:NAD(P)-dependent oxidoreductase [Euzebyaceae bacterium]
MPGRPVIGVVHPGEMGAAVAACVSPAADRVLWASQGRSAATRRRAEAAGLSDVGDLAAMCRNAEILLSVCPPDAAVEVATAVAGSGYDGLYVDANAIAPPTARHAAEIVEAAGARFVDGGIIGSVPRVAGRTRLYLSGPGSHAVAALFEGSVLEAVVLHKDSAPRPVGAASALKMTYAAYTKGRAALLLAIRAAAVAEGVDADLVAEWQRPGSTLAELADDCEAVAARGAPKAWRWSGEMTEIAATLEAAGLPGGFHEAAADIYRRLRDLRDADAPPLDEVIAALLTDVRSESRRG